MGIFSGVEYDLDLLANLISYLIRLNFKVNFIYF